MTGQFDVRAMREDIRSAIYLVRAGSEKELEARVEIRDDQTDADQEVGRPQKLSINA
jgi:hypothetical protein